MSDAPINFGKSKEEVALELFRMIVKSEGHNPLVGLPREYALTTYFECLQVTTGYEPKKK